MLNNIGLQVNGSSLEHAVRKFNFELGYRFVMPVPPFVVQSMATLAEARGRTDVAKELRAALEQAEVVSFLEINQTAHKLINQLRLVENDTTLRPEIADRAKIYHEGLRFIAKESCEKYEPAGGFNRPANLREVAP